MERKNEDSFRSPNTPPLQYSIILTYCNAFSIALTNFAFGTAPTICS